ncbi:hypothetical protein [Ornithinimicrobium tianjinense]|uniref:Uncharacterized protein n=1 Tax=Ornithinimicrobium tianjinense TaxID=1195761 RepID=A0A917BI28_9MICO|nr:hypothetical protein [Ornithinimicrobium tianjinense]GGF44829.1 hypothetical protein GCM10011366_10690 [Ornithinimicrobium tianjinense]
MGRHTHNEGRSPGLLLPLGLVGVLAAGGVTWYAVTQGGDDRQPASAGSSSAASTSVDAAMASAIKDAHGDHAAVTSDAPAEVTETTAPAEETTVAEGVPDELAACAVAVGEGEQAAEAAALSAKHWKTHYVAQIKLESGEYTLEQTKKAWADTKVLGADDVKRFTDAKAAYDKVSGACSDLDPSALEGEYAEAGTACAERATVLADVVGTGKGVNDDWNAHLEQMKVKEQTPADEYYEWWIDVVEAAPKNMKPYEAAVKQLGSAPSCDVS